MRATKHILIGLASSLLLFGVYIGAVTLVSGWDFAIDQLGQYWYFILPLSLGFGIQMGLYAYLRFLMKGQHVNGKVVGFTGTTSTIAMVSCCTHYLVNFLPILGAWGVASFVDKYQIELFVVALVFNLLGVIKILSAVIKAKKT